MIWIGQRSDVSGWHLGYTFPKRRGVTDRSVKDFSAGARMLMQVSGGEDPGLAGDPIYPELQTLGKLASEKLDGVRVLLVEDNYLIAMLMTDVLRSFGCDIVGPVASVDDALEKVKSAELDAAVLDINVIGGSSAPIAEELSERGVPYLFVTGYGSPKVLSEGLRQKLRLNKPVDERTLKLSLIKVMSEKSA